jgi:DNA topoisomerase-2
MKIDLPQIKARQNVTVKDLFAGPVRAFSIYNNQRMIPSAIDGFKPSQRKVMCGILDRASSIDHDKGMKVAQLASFCALHTDYHHGEGSLAGVISNMAQDFPGSNNLNYLRPIGQFGSRLSPEPGAARYIFTDLMPSWRKIFPRDDDLVLEYDEEEGVRLEPKWYLPILPNVLINGANGMGTGHATSILSYNPDDLKKYILNVLKGKKQNVKLTPWFRGYTGQVTRGESGQVTVKGVLTKVNSTTLRITELPIGVYEDEYKLFLIELEEKGTIKSFTSDSSAERWDWTITVPREVGYKDEEELYRIFKLSARSTENFTVWKANGFLHKFDSAEDLCDYFIEYRLVKYEERRQAKIKELNELLLEQNERLRFIRYYIANSERVAKRTRAELEEILRGEKFTLIDRLLEVKIYNLTRDQIEKLEKQIVETQSQLDHFHRSTASSLYVADLEALDLSKELRGSGNH